MSAAMHSRAFAGTRTDHFVFSPVRGRNRAKSFELVPGGRAGISMGMKLPEPARTTVTNEAALLGWFETALPGECFTYHIGHLAADCARESSGLAATARDMLGCIADRVMALVTEGRLIAVQRRLDDGRTAYLAIKAGMRSAGRSAR
jgi:hypothetical protein